MYVVIIALLLSPLIGRAQETDASSIRLSLKSGPVVIKPLPAAAAAPGVLLRLKDGSVISQKTETLNNDVCSYTSDKLFLGRAGKKGKELLWDSRLHEKEILLATPAMVPIYFHPLAKNGRKRRCYSPFSFAKIFPLTDNIAAHLHPLYAPDNYVLLAETLSTAYFIDREFKRVITGFSLGGSFRFHNIRLLPNASFLIVKYLRTRQQAALAKRPEPITRTCIQEYDLYRRQAFWKKCFGSKYHQYTGAFSHKGNTYVAFYKRNGDLEVDLITEDHKIERQVTLTDAPLMDFSNGDFSVTD